MRSEVKRNAVKRSKANWSEAKWSVVKWSDAKWSVRTTVQLYNVTRTCTSYTAVSHGVYGAATCCLSGSGCLQRHCVLGARVPSWNVTVLPTASVNGPRWLVDPEKNMVHRVCSLTALVSVVHIIWRRTWERWIATEDKSWPMSGVPAIAGNFWGTLRRAWGEPGWSIKCRAK